MVDLCIVKLIWDMFQDKASKAMLSKIHAMHYSGQKGLHALICTFLSIFIMWNDIFLIPRKRVNDCIIISLTSACACSMFLTGGEVWLESNTTWK